MYKYNDFLMDSYYLICLADSVDFNLVLILEKI